MDLDLFTHSFAVERRRPFVKLVERQPLGALRTSTILFGLEEPHQFRAPFFIPGFSVAHRLAVGEEQRIRQPIRVDERFVVIYRNGWFLRRLPEAKHC